MLRKIHIEGYRSCFDTSFECHPNLSVLVGPNGSGKTNALQAIMLLSRMAQQEGRLSRAIAGVTSKLRFEFVLNEIRVRLAASVETQTDETNKDIVTQSEQRWWLSRKSKNKRSNELVRSKIPLAWAFGRFISSPAFVARHFQGSFRVHSAFARQRLYLPALEEKLPEWAQTTLGQVAGFCERIRYYGASQFTNPGACPVSFEIEKEGDERKVSRLTGHAKFLYNIYSANRTGASGKYKRFFDIVGPGGLKLIDSLDFKEVETSSVNYTVKVGGKVERRRRRQIIIIPQFRIGRQKLSPNQLSEGTFKTLALLFYVVTDESSALLIEEPEVCIHHGLLSSVLELIKRFSRQKQMFISTHSDYVLDHVQPENVFRVTCDSKSGTSVRHIRKTMTTKEFLALKHYLDTEGNLGEYWREGGLEDLT